MFCFVFLKEESEFFDPSAPEFSTAKQNKPRNTNQSSKGGYLKTEQKKETHRVLFQTRPQPLVGQDVDGLKRDVGRGQDLHDCVGEAALRKIFRSLDEGDDAVLGDEVVEGGLELRGEAGGAAWWGEKEKGERERERKRELVEVES